MKARSLDSLNTLQTFFNQTLYFQHGKIWSPMKLFFYMFQMIIHCTEVHFRYRSACRLPVSDVLAWNVLACGCLTAWPPPSNCLQTRCWPSANLLSAYLHSCFLSPACRSMGSSLNQLLPLFYVRIQIRIRRMDAYVFWASRIRIRNYLFDSVSNPGSGSFQQQTKQLR